MNEKRALRQGIFLSLLMTAGGFTVTAPPVFPQESQPAAVSAGAPGMTIHVDPQTGAILKEPAPGTVPLQLSPQLLNALSTSHQGLVETPSSVAGGGIKLDLQGRFQNPLIVTIDANGKVKMQHLGETPAVADTP
jgi:hypothetical protein